MKKMIFPILFLLIMKANLFGQIQIWEILTTSNQPYKNVVLDKISNDTIIIKVLEKIVNTSEKNLKKSN